jgi:hypothetical protein
LLQSPAELARCLLEHLHIPENKYVHLKLTDRHEQQRNKD